MEELPKRSAASRLQTALNRLLNGFINYHPGGVLPRFGLKGLDRLLGELQSTAHDGSFATLPEAARLASLASANALSRRHLARILSTGYQLLDGSVRRLDSQGLETVMLPASRAYDPVNYDAGRVRWINALIEAVNARLVSWTGGFWIHGSFSTLDYCDFSDVDTLLLVRRSTILEPDALRSFQEECYDTTKFLYLVDPYQHHGHTALTEVDLSFYDTSVFPIELFPYATSIRDQQPLEVQLRQNDAERREALRAVCQRICGAAERGAPRSRYGQKLFISHILLLPTLFLQALGKHCYKRDSFALAAPYFSTSEWSVVEQASAIRLEWKLDTAECAALERLLIRTHNPYPWSVLRRRRAHRLAAPTQLGTDQSLLVARAGQLANVMLSRAGG